jgi:hypothetical protein
MKRDLGYWREKKVGEVRVKREEEGTKIQITRRQTELKEGKN